MHTVAHTSEIEQLKLDAGNINVILTLTPYQSIESKYTAFNKEIKQLEASKNVLESELVEIEQQVKTAFTDGGDLYWECIIRIQNLKTKWKFIEKKKPAVTPDISYPLSIEYMDDALLQLRFDAFFNIGRAARNWIKEQLQMKGITQFNSEEELMQHSKEMLEIYKDIWEQCLVPTNEEQWLKSLTRLGFDNSLIDGQKLYQLYTHFDKSNVYTLNQLQIQLRKMIEKYDLIKANALGILSINPFMKSIAPSLALSS
ncbi:hypothetical protein [Bacillus dakarensis]|uniref:hypothetical protein n=1 Tax=Robertmurraya dakarensis TaxID=1926278 RepID=UPI001115AC02|nr:hypothetical protein [Bacillus dakarensis]